MSQMSLDFHIHSQELIAFVDSQGNGSQKAQEASNFFDKISSQEIKCTPNSQSQSQKSSPELPLSTPSPPDSALGTGSSNSHSSKNSQYSYQIDQNQNYLPSTNLNPQPNWNNFPRGSNSNSPSKYTNVKKIWAQQHMPNADRPMSPPAIIRNNYPGKPMPQSSKHSEREDLRKSRLGLAGFGKSYKRLIDEEPEDRQSYPKQVTAIDYTNNIPNKRPRTASLSSGATGSSACCDSDVSSESEHPNSPNSPYKHLFNTSSIYQVEDRLFPDCQVAPPPLTTTTLYTSVRSTVASSSFQSLEFNQHNSDDEEPRVKILCYPRQSSSRQSSNRQSSSRQSSSSRKTPRPESPLDGGEAQSLDKKERNRQAAKRLRDKRRVEKDQSSLELEFWTDKVEASRYKLSKNEKEVEEYRAKLFEQANQSKP